MFVVSSALFAYPLKTENLKRSFQGVEKWCIGNEWVKIEHFHLFASSVLSFYLLQLFKNAKPHHSSLTHFSPKFHFYTHFSGKMEHCAKMGESIFH